MPDTELIQVQFHASIFIPVVLTLEKIVRKTSLPVSSRNAVRTAANVVSPGVVTPSEHDSLREARKIFCCLANAPRPRSAAFPVGCGIRHRAPPGLSAEQLTAVLPGLVYSQPKKHVKGVEQA